MPQAKLYKALSAIPNAHIRIDEPIAAHTPLRIGGRAHYWAWIYNEDALVKAMKLAKRAKCKWRIHWPLGDWIARDGGFRGIILRLAGCFERIEQTETGLDIGSAVTWSEAAQHSPWISEMSAWPGTVGGLFESEQQDRLRGFPMLIYCRTGQTHKVLEIKPGQKIPTLENGAVPSKITICGPRKKTTKRPHRSGHIFKSAKGSQISESLTDHALCGVRLRDWLVSTTSPGLVVNLNRGSCSDLLLLSKGLQDRIKRLSGHKFELRIPIIGTDKRE